MVAVLRKDIRSLMMTERIMPRVWMHRRSMRQLSRRERAMHGTEETSQIWISGSVNFRILTLGRRSHALIIGNSQPIKSFTKRQVPRGGVYGGLVILTHPRLMVRECTLIFEPSRGFWFSKNTRIAQNTTSITNRQDLLTPKVQTLL